jgi:hypothetical protein
MKKLKIDWYTLFYLNIILNRYDKCTNDEKEIIVYLWEIDAILKKIDNKRLWIIVWQNQ